MHEVAFRSGRALLAALLVVSVTTGCSGDDDDDTTAVQCSTLVADRVVPAPIDVGGTPPAATGGTIVEGSYVLTAATTYMASNSQVLPKCNALADALVLTNGGFEHAVGCFEADNPKTRLANGDYVGSYSVSDTAFSFEHTCPAARVNTFEYSAEPTSLRMLVPDSTHFLTTELVWTLE